jgi:hypothetical protein
LEPLRRTVLAELAADPEPLLVDSTLLSVLHPRQVAQSAGFEGAAWAVWGSFAVYGMKLHLLCSTNRVPLSYELSAANTAEVPLVGELLAAADLEEEEEEEEGGVARRLLGDLAYRSAKLGDDLADVGVQLATERADQRPRVLASRSRCASPRSSGFSG